MRTLAIGDVHGHATALRSLIQWLEPEPQDTVVMLGDYINRGPDSCDVIETILELERRCHVVALLGNHDEVMRRSRYHRDEYIEWCEDGGVDTLRSYSSRATLEDVPESHWKFLDRCVDYFETDRFAFVHANYCWYQPFNFQPATLLRWTSIDELPPRRHCSGKSVILGHLPGEVRDFGHFRCIDTGCGFGGPLTAMDVHTGQLWQVYENGVRV